LDVVHSVALPPKVRRPTKPTLASQRKRLESKKKLSETKLGRSKVI
jgi:ribosome-associated protein